MERERIAMKKMLAAISIAAVLAIVPVTITKAVDNDLGTDSATVMSGKWIHGAGWWYQYEDGSYPKNCFSEISGKTYYFDNSGYMVTGWQKINGEYYYFDDNGAMTTGWQSINGRWYYFYESGVMVNCATEINNKKQMFTPSGQWVNNWTFDTYKDTYDSGITYNRYRWYYANADGTPYDYNKNDDIQGGWLQRGGKWYYIDYDGEMLNGRKITVYGKKYRLRSDGSMVTGWYQRGSDWYYSNADGTVYDGWLLCGKDWYYISDGHMEKSTWIDSKGKAYYLGEDGKLVSGWYCLTFKSAVTTSTVWKYMNPDGSRYTGWVSSGGQWYYIKDSVMLADKWDACINKEDYRNSDGKIDDKYYVALNDARGYVFDTTGAMVTGWYHTTGYSNNQNVYGNNWYYMDDDGQGYNGWLKNNGSWYYFSKGSMKTNCYAPDGSYLGADGVSRKNITAVSANVPAITNAADNNSDTESSTTVKSGKWILGSRWWYQYDDGSYPKNCFLKINGKTYYFDNSGYMVTGWQKKGWDNYYYFDTNGAMVTGWQKIDGKWYYFYESGKMAQRIVKINNKNQVFAPSGQWVSGWTFDTHTEPFGNVNRTYRGWYYANVDGTPYDYNKNDDIDGGWLQYGGKWYYIGSGGTMLTDRTVTVYGKKYRLKDDGSMLTGWDQSHGEWYYSNPDGTVYDGWLLYGKDWYYLSNGYMNKGKWIDSKGKEYYLGRDGKLASGWYSETYRAAGITSTRWMYMNSDGSRYTGWVSSGGKWYYIIDSQMISDVRSSCINIEDYRNSDGEINKEYYTVENNTRGYVFDNTGAMVTTGWYHVMGSVYNGNPSGSKWYYVDADGQAHNGWLKYNGSWYYFEKGRMLTDCYAPDGSYLGSDGISRKIR
ncbi:MAG TPA: hypothetical protein DCM21_10595 [Butyrivibrio sp.]|nr:hypothetical protein [Butyrivibrio sp.]